MMRHALAHRLLPLLLCLGLLIMLRWGELGVASQGPHSTTVAIGFLLVGAFLGGKAAARLGLGLISEAGVTLALAAILARVFSGWGAAVQPADAAGLPDAERA